MKRVGNSSGSNGVSLRTLTIKNIHVLVKVMKCIIICKTVFVLVDPLLLYCVFMCSFVVINIINHFTNTFGNTYITVCILINNSLKLYFIPNIDDDTLNQINFVYFKFHSSVYIINF